MGRFAKNAVLVITGVFLAMTLSDASAASKWYTARTVNGRTQPLSAGTQTITMPDGRTVGINSATVSGGLIDLVISLYNDPKGDDNGNTQDVDPASISQDAYEKIIQYFADGVYEATEGAHKIRNVRVYRGGLRQDADVTWQASGHPGAWYMNQQGIDATIHMYDNFSGHNFTNNVAEHEVGGYTLAHEFGHYFYGMLDEYCVWNNGWVTLAAANRASPCIMNDQWSAAGRVYTWLNHSIMVNTNSAAYANYECHTDGAQYQHYGDGSWPVLSRDPAGDPLDTARRQWLRTNRGMRMYYPELAAVAPTGVNPPRIDLSSATALSDLASRQDLNIIWMGTNVVVEIIIDESGSMGGSPLTSAKAAAKLLVDQIPDNSAVGVIGFDDSVYTISGITVVTSATMRTSIKTAIDASSGGGWTAIGDAALEGLSQLQAFGRTNFTRVAFLLSDGESNTGSDPLEAAASYQSAQIPIMTFGYGYVNSDLVTMADMTGGNYYYSPASLAAISAAFQDAFTAISARQNLADGTFMASATSAKGAVAISIPFQVDSTIADIDVTVGYNATNTVALNLTDPNGVAHPAVSTNQSGTDRLLSFSASSPTNGQWVIGGTASAGASLRYQVNGGVNGFSYYLTAVSMGGDDVAYPNPIQIVARLNRGPAVNGAVVKATITDQQTNTTSLTLDNTANGTYSGTFMPTNDSIFSIVVSADNSANTATYTYADILPSATDSGEVGTVTPDTAVNESFTRTTSLQVTMTGTEYSSLPAIPSGVTATEGFCLDYVKVSWNAAADASCYQIWRSDNSSSESDAVLIAQVDRAYDSYMDTAVTVRNSFAYRYYYWVKAVNFKGASGFSSAHQGWPLFGPAIRVDDASTITLDAGNYVNVTALIRAGEFAGVPCDWWVVAYGETAGVFYYLDSNGSWQPAAGLADMRPVYQGPLFDITTPLTLLNWNGLPAGTWKFFFGVDPNVNGYLDADSVCYNMAILYLQ